MSGAGAAAAVAIGVDEQGRPPLPWLAAPMARALALQRSHALLASGPAGVGQLEFGLLLAQRWLCEDAPDDAPMPCGRCAACRLVRARSHPDLLVGVPGALRVALGWVGEDDPLLKSDAKPSKELRIDQMRDAIDWSQRTAARGRGKALVLHPADAMNGPTANALLKTLEEPPGRLRIVLTTADAQRLLPTVRSRCQQLALPLPAAADALAWLAGRGIADAQPLLAVAAGSPLEAAALAAEGLEAAWLAALPRAVAAGDPRPLAGRPLPRVIDLLGKLVHDGQLAAAGLPPRYYPAGSLPKPASAQALIDWHQNLRRAARHDEHPWNAALLLEALVTEGARAFAGAAARAGRGQAPSLHSAR